MLYQLSLGYDLGRACGLTYVHTPFRNRWCPSLNATKFLGLDIGERKIEEFSGWKFLDVHFIKAYDCHVAGKPLESLISAAALRPKVMYRFDFEAAERKSAIYNLPIAIPQLRLASRFRAIHASKLDQINPFKTDKIKVALHIRRGDCTWVEYEGKAYFTYQHKYVALDSGDVDLTRALPMSYYTNTLDLLFSLAPKEEFEIRVYSDGHKRSLFPCKEALKALCHSMNLLNILRKTTRRPLNYLPYNRSYCDGFTKSEFCVLGNFDADITMCIGQSEEVTKETIAAFAFADVSVIARPFSFPDLVAEESQIKILPSSSPDWLRSRLKDLIEMKKSKNQVSS
jgi:hypothetical protein